MGAADPDQEVAEVRRWAADWAVRVACADLDLPLVRVQWIKAAYATEVLSVAADERDAVFVSNADGPFLGMASRLHPDVVYVMADMPVAQTASTTLHEVRHQFQYRRGL